MLIVTSLSWVWKRIRSASISSLNPIGRMETTTTWKIPMWMSPQILLTLSTLIRTPTSFIWPPVRTCSTVILFTTPLWPMSICHSPCVIKMSTCWQNPSPNLILKLFLSIITALKTMFRSSFPRCRSSLYLQISFLSSTFSTICCSPSIIRASHYGTLTLTATYSILICNTWSLGIRQCPSKAFLVCLSHSKISTRFCNDKNRPLQVCMQSWAYGEKCDLNQHLQETRVEDIRREIDDEGWTTVQPTRWSSEFESYPNWFVRGTAFCSLFQGERGWSMSFLDTLIPIEFSVLPWSQLLHYSTL